MNKITFQTLQKSKARLEACLEVDEGLNIYIRAEIKDIVELIDRILDEATNKEHAE